MATDLKRIRESKGITQAKLARKIGITRGYYSMIESGKRGGKNGVSYSLAIKIASALDSKPDDIFLH
ncbi:helix-turn-helix transcriptional regulator [Lactiplantibacillus modestisalitolerans]|uniref:Helix-turn-helix transcriptional regulator n=1 Tax=Lactiplantibacillus modestisalitolerans TaxID=1457219 RepID=A0ABV5WVF9_9LACO|nr:helix-turn-helix transcriptional regulator [Lactiplantibacillus modestisalitolerans]